MVCILPSQLVLRGFFYENSATAKVRPYIIYFMFFCFLQNILKITKMLLSSHTFKKD
jgi:hypothetical protein